ncbi:hypothetical protein [Leptospira stimsonii]|uniref:Lipoprotein n=1 Tax=Leptospira stimsonii TaxID=2202203 RepID=A0ABY2MV07_9LEPT|nr:hypothetical protein [Leptospira stimsonii]TGK25377.1 hypothetical protein EHO98_02975 [Leptospira stimsonii]TGM08796.1 hypothetical protein EHQ90_22160 [Leptospira stimsonii]
MKRFLALFLIFSFVSCSSYQAKVEKNKSDLDQVNEIVSDSDDIPPEEKKFVKDTITKAKKLLDKGVSESALADKWRDYLFNKWLYVSLFVLGIIALLILKFKSIPWTSLFSKFSFGGKEDA